MSQHLAPTSLLIPLATGLALWTYGRAQVDPAAGAETLFLALLVTAVLLPIAALAVRPTVELGIPAVLITATVWVVPAGPARGAAVGLLLLSTLAVAALHRLETQGRQLDWSLAIPVALALQLLIRSDRLVDLELAPRALVGLVALPVAAAAALVVLARRRRSNGVLLAGGAALVLSPGYSVSVTLALLALAAGDLARDDALPRWLRWAGGLALAGVTLAWEPVLALPILACAVIQAGGGTWRVSLGVAAAAAVAALLLPAARGATQCLGQLALVPLVLPAAVALLWRRPATALGGALLAAAALRLVPDPGALAAPVGLLALALDDTGERDEVQLIWVGLLTAGVTLLAAYPWVRDLPLIDATGLAGLDVGWPAALTVLAAWFLLGEGLTRLRDRWPSMAPPASGATLALVALAMFASLPPAALRPLEDQVVLVDAGRPRLVRDLPPGTRVAEVVVDSYLSDSASLAAGTPVADLRIFTTDGRRYEWTLRAGIESGEWAARRKDVAALPGFAAPRPWLSWVAPGGSVLAQRYRSRWRPATAAGEAVEARRLEIVRRGELAESVALAVFHLELRP